MLSHTADNCIMITFPHLNVNAYFKESSVKILKKTTKLRNILIIAPVGVEKERRHGEIALRGAISGADFAVRLICDI